jgi:hypothetical protein
VFLNSNVDELFDVFNSRKLYCKLKPHNAAISKTTLHLTFLKNRLTWFCSMKFVGAKSTLPCVEGWKLYIAALLGLWANLE